MKINLITICFLICTGSAALADTPLQTDTDVCSHLLAKAVTSILPPGIPAHESTVGIVYKDGLHLFSPGRTSIDTLMTGRDCTLADENADVTFEITVTDCMVLLTPHINGYNRSISITVHVKGIDRNSDVFFALTATESAHGFIPKKSAEATDDIHRFSRDIARSVIGQRRTMTMIASLILISGVLIYFSNQ
ncbi:hypothetical protein ACFL47_07420 [Candidatus Latescibacterota bacterium]